jgi:hypothetical protein
MELVDLLRQALDRITSSGRVEVRENGSWLATLDGFQYEVRPQNGAALLHLWSARQTQVSSVTRILRDEPDRVSLEVSRLGRPRPGKLEFLTTHRRPAANRIVREQFRCRLKDILSRRFPDETVVSLSSAADLEHSLSGSYVRGLMRYGPKSWALLAAAPSENLSVIDGLLTFGLIWLDRARQLSRETPAVHGLRLFFPEGTGRATTHRLAALSPATAVELYEYCPRTGRLRRTDPSDAGNVESWLAQRHVAEQMLTAAAPFLERLRRYAPGAIQPHLVPGTDYLEIRYRGLAFARWQPEAVFFGLGDRQQLLSAGRETAFEKLLADLNTYRSPLAAGTSHALYRAQPERWLESLVAAEPGRVDARLDPRFIYAQVPALSIGDRGVMDLVGITRDGRLTVLELKAQEDIHMPLQAVDYWLRVRWHHSREEFSRYGYFPGVTVDSRPPRLLLLAPSLRFHPATDVVLRHLNPQIEIERIGVSEHWRRGVKVVLRQAASRPVS